MIEGWIPYIDNPPQRNQRIEIWRREWARPQATMRSEFPPWMNVAGLYWRPAPETAGTHHGGE